MKSPRYFSEGERNGRGQVILHRMARMRRAKAQCLREKDVAGLSILLASCQWQLYGMMGGANPHWAGLVC